MEGKRIIIVGGGSGIGLQLAKQLIMQGAQVVIASRDIVKLDGIVSELGPLASAFELDASNEQEVIDFFAEVGRFDHLVSSIKPKHLIAPFNEASSEDSRSAFDAKFWGQYYLARHCLDAISTEGSIIFTSGIASSRGYAGFSGTAAINGAIESLTKSLAVELAPIRVNAVSPGFIERFEHDSQRLVEIVKLGGRMPVDRLGHQDEAAQAYLYLLANNYANGTILTIDGGELCA